MSRASVLARGRAAAEAGMIDTCLIRRRSGEFTDNGGTVTTTWATIYEGLCRFQQESSGASAATVEHPGEAYVQMVQRELQLPVTTSAGIRADDQVLPTAVANDPDMVGRVFFIRGEVGKSEATSRRLRIEEVTS